MSVGLFAIDYCAIDCFALRGSSFIFDFEWDAGNFLSDFIWFSVLLKDYIFYLFKGVNVFGFDFDCLSNLIYFLSGLWEAVTGLIKLA